MPYTIIDRLYEENRALIMFLDDRKETSLHVSADSNFRKILLLSAASYFEHEITKILVECVSRHSHGNPVMISLLKKKAIERQYHTFFDWEGSNANKFFSLFGTDFKDSAG